MFSSYGNSLGKPRTQVERVFKIGSEFIGWPVLLLLFTPTLAVFVAAFLTPSGELSQIAAIAAQHHGWVLAVLIMLGVITIAGWMLQNSAFEVWDSNELDPEAEKSGDE